MVWRLNGLPVCSHEWMYVRLLEDSHCSEKLYQGASGPGVHVHAQHTLISLSLNFYFSSDIPVKSSVQFYIIGIDSINEATMVCNAF